MKISILAMAFFEIACVVKAQTVQHAFEGCPNPSVIAGGLRTLREIDWQDISNARLQKIWPTQLMGLECVPTSCTILAHQGRLINNRPECAEVFDFDVAKDASAAENEKLRTITIHYTTHSRPEIVSIALVLASATGMTSKVTPAIGQDPIQHLGWDTGKFHYSLELRWVPVGDNWNLFFVLDQERRHSEK